MSAVGAPSLRSALLAWLLLPLVGLVPLAAALMYVLALRPALDGLDRALTDSVLALAQILEVRDGRVALPLSEQTARALSTDAVDAVVMAVGDDEDHLLYGDGELLAQVSPLEREQWRFFDTSVHGRPMRVASYGAACGNAARVCPILVAESLGKRNDAERRVLGAAAASAVVLALSLVSLALLAVRRGLVPLHRAAAEIEKRSLESLQPIDDRAVPRETASFVQALNGLFDRLRRAAAAQRAFLADASHQLRTPLATLRSDAAQALQQPHPQSLRPTLERLHAAAERGSRLAQQLLALARLDGAALDAGAPPSPVDLHRLAAASADDWIRASLATAQDLGFELAPARVLGRELLLRELLDNLIHNAIEHAGAGARITVRTRREGDSAVLEVEDDGPGIAAEDREDVWERFHRGRGALGHGSGLGLAIVRDIVRAHGAQAALLAGAEGRGLLVRVTFAALAQAA